MIVGSRAAVVTSMIRAMGFRPMALTCVSDISTRAAAPSFRPQELPAVTVPSGFTMGRSFASTSKVVVGFTNSSVSNMNSFFFSFTWTGTISSLKYPA